MQGARRQFCDEDVTTDLQRKQGIIWASLPVRARLPRFLPAPQPSIV